MKRILSITVALIVLVAVLGGCAGRDSNTIEGNIKTYYAQEDGTWECEGRTYQYRLEISGKMPGAEYECTFVYLSNFTEISFEQAWKNAGLSSHSSDYFDRADAVLVEWK